VAQIKAVCFDLDLTLLDYDDDAYARTVASVCSDLAALFPVVDATQLMPAHHELNRARWQDTLATSFRDLDGLTGRRIWLDTWQQALSTCGHDDPAIAAAALELYMAYRHKDYRLFDDAIEVLEALHGRVKLALITNGPSDTQRDKLTFLDLERHFDYRAISSEVGLAKPDAAIFHHALAHLGVEPHGALHVGDSLLTDALGAVDAGLTGVWLNRRGLVREVGQPAPSHEIASLPEIVALLND